MCHPDGDRAHENSFRFGPSPISERRAMEAIAL